MGTPSLCCMPGDSRKRPPEGGLALSTLSADHPAGQKAEGENENPANHHGYASFLFIRTVTSAEKTTSAFWFSSTQSCLLAPRSGLDFEGIWSSTST